MKIKKKRKIPFGWRLEKIKDIGQTGSGGTPLSTKKEFYENGTIPWVNSGEVNGFKIKSHKKYITRKGLENSSAKLFPIGSVLIAMYGATAGKAAILDFEAAINQAICAIDLKPGYSNYFLKYYLDSIYDYLVGISTGSARDNLSQNGIGNLEIPFPILSEQKKIAKVLSDLDGKIALNNKINTQLEGMAKLIYDYWFVQFDFPDKNGKPYKSSGGKMVYNDQLKREIPEGWEVDLIADCCSIVDCLHSKKPDYHYEKETCFLLQLNNIKDDGLIDLSKKYYVREEDYLKWTKRIVLKNDDIVITNAGRVAANAQVPDNIIAGIGRNITAIRPVSIPPTYLYLAFQGEDMRRQILWNTDTGSFFKSLNVKGIKKLWISRPNGVIEKRFEEIVLPMRRKREKIQLENEKISKLRDWLLPMLMNGQVQVKEEGK